NFFSFSYCSPPYIYTLSLHDALPISGFNPYNGHPNAGLQGLVYETLYFVNVNGGSFTPMLATDYKWNSDNTQVTFTIRQNVKWRSEEHTSELQSRFDLVCRLLLEKKK